MYARGMTVREIQGHLAELYGIDVSPDLISAVTDAILDEIAEWQNRPLEAVYPLVFFDALRVPCRSPDRHCCAPSASAPMAARRSWVSGSSRPRGPSSGCG